MNSLLIGNGLNLTNKENNFLNTKEIASRFKDNLSIYWNVIEKLIYKDKLDISEILKRLDKNKGIEELSGIVFGFLYDEIKKEREFSWNDCYRLVEILGEISLKSIFFKDTFMIPKVTSEYVSIINQRYENIFSLNYIEDWDINRKVNYLHGNLKKYLKEGIDIGSNILSHNEDYIKFKTSEYAKVDFLDVVFMPTNDILNKYNYIEEGLFPEKCGLSVYPANDLFPYGGKDMYSALNEIQNIDIFGMSPYGDKALIDKISKIENVKIYIYNLNESEINKWREFGVNANFIDSKEFLKN